MVWLLGVVAGTEARAGSLGRCRRRRGRGRTRWRARYGGFHDSHRAADGRLFAYRFERWNGTSGTSCHGKIIQLDRVAVDGLEHSPGRAIGDPNGIVKTRQICFGREVGDCDLAGSGGSGIWLNHNACESSFTFGRAVGGYLFNDGGIFKVPPFPDFEGGFGRCEYPRLTVLAQGA